MTIIYDLNLKNTYTRADVPRAVVLIIYEVDFIVKEITKQFTTILPIRFEHYSSV